MVGTLTLNRKNIPQEMKTIHLKKGELLAAENNGILILKLKDDLEMVAAKLKRSEIMKP
jgi:hypothetical protein